MRRHLERKVWVVLGLGRCSQTPALILVARGGVTPGNKFAFYAIWGLSARPLRAAASGYCLPGPLGRLRHGGSSTIRKEEKVGQKGEWFPAAVCPAGVNHEYTAALRDHWGGFWLPHTKGVGPFLGGQ